MEDLKSISKFYLLMCFESSRNKACFQTVWHEEFDARIWDKQFEGDLYFGKLDKIANQVFILGIRSWA